MNCEECLQHYILSALLSLTKIFNTVMMSCEAYMIYTCALGLALFSKVYFAHLLF